MRWMNNPKRIAELARELTGLLCGVIYALLACSAFAFAFYSCSQPSAQRQPTPLPTLIIATQQPPIEPTPTPIAGPDFVPLPEDAQFTQIAAGERHACGLQADGTPLCWGRNVNDSLKIPGGNLT